MRRDTIMVSGGFDPIHGGHVDMIRHAANFGSVIVALNSDDWLMRKKGYVFMPWKDRAKILEQFRYVRTVSAVDDTDGTVCAALKFHRPTYFANGGDRTSDNTPELDVCRQLGVTPLFNIGGFKTDSSSELVKRVRKNLRN